MENMIFGMNFRVDRVTSDLGRKTLVKEMGRDLDNWCTAK